MTTPTAAEREKAVDLAPCNCDGNWPNSAHLPACHSWRQPDIALALADARTAALEEAAEIAEDAIDSIDGDYCESCKSVTYSSWRAAEKIRGLAKEPT
jgi:hypothetical protein